MRLLLSEQQWNFEKNHRILCENKNKENFRSLLNIYGGTNKKYAVNHKAVCRTAPATPGVLTIHALKFFLI